MVSVLVMFGLGLTRFSGWKLESKSSDLVLFSKTRISDCAILKNRRLKNENGESKI